MSNEIITFEEYLEKIPDERKYPILNLRETIKKNIPGGFEEYCTNSFIHFVVPFHLYPAGYHANKNMPLPFISIASQKNYLALYHLGIYAFEEILDWFTQEYSKCSTTKLDMGKSCIRFKNLSQIPYELIARLSKRITVDMWIDKYENTIKK